jgi:hypothetical protein
LTWGDDGASLHTRHTSRLRSECTAVDDAARWLLRGDVVVVAGADMFALRQKLAALAKGND